MVPTLCLLTCVLATAQPAEATPWLLAPRLGRGQELVYSGSYTEETLGKPVQFARNYRLEIRAFVLDVSARSMELAILTVLRSKPAQNHLDENQQPSAVRLELVKLDSQGRLTPETSKSLSVPLEGPATVECGGFVEVPRIPTHLKQKWEVAEEGRPPHVWQVTGSEVISGTSCLKLEGLQASADWEQARADRTAWRRCDTVWIAPNSGIAYRVERSIERREPARQEASQRSVVTYNLDSRVTYPGQLFEDRRREVMQARTLDQMAEPYLRDPAQNGTRPLEVVLAKIAYHIDNQPATPFRVALLHVKNRIETVQRGESSGSEMLEPIAPVSLKAAINQMAPNFAVTDLAKRQSTRLRNLLGKPILLVFYNPSSRTAEDQLRFAQKINEQHGTLVKVLALTVSDDTQQALKQREQLKLTVPVLAGEGLRLTYEVEGTPKFVVLDSRGLVRGAYLGWGPETQSLVTEELKNWLQESERK